MEISFADHRLQDRCESQRQLQRVYGLGVAKKLMLRLSDLNAAATLEDFRALPGRCHELQGDRKGQFALELPNGKRLVFEPAEATPSSKDGAVSWADIEAIRVLEIVDYH
jgi:proteic killer suppression protein